MSCNSGEERLANSRPWIVDASCEEPNEVVCPQPLTTTRPARWGQAYHRSPCRMGYAPRCMAVHFHLWRTATWYTLFVHIYHQRRLLSRLCTPHPRASPSTPLARHAYATAVHAKHGTYRSIQYTHLPDALVPRSLRAVDRVRHLFCACSLLFSGGGAACLNASVIEANRIYYTCSAGCDGETQRRRLLAGRIADA